MFRQLILRRANAQLYRSAVIRRQFHSGMRVMQKDQPLSEEYLESLRSSPTYQKVMESAELKDRFIDLAMYLKSQGLATEGKPPSAMQVAKIMMNKEARDKVTELAQALQREGVDLKSQEFADMIKNMSMK